MLYILSNDEKKRKALVLSRLDSKDGVSKVVERNTNASNSEESVVREDNELGARMLKEKVVC